MGTWLLGGELDGQHTTQPLVPGEQFGVGGMNAVRGLNERVLSDDRGVRMALQATTPPLMFGARMNVFVDAGSLRRLEPLPGEVDRGRVVTGGAGVRWSLGRRLNLRLDYGRVLDVDRDAAARGLAEGDSRVHFSAVMRF